MDCEGRVLRFHRVQEPETVTITALVIREDVIWEAEISMPRPESDNISSEWMATCIAMLEESVRMGEEDEEP
jgi:hypothetical protein